MRLEINNFAKIRKASIDIDGITVIAGNNNTGKSTVGKVLFSMYNALCDIAEQVDRQRKKRLQFVCGRPLRNIFFHLENDPSTSISQKMMQSQGLVSDSICRDLMEYLLNIDPGKLTREGYKKCVGTSCDHYGVELSEDALNAYIDDTYDRVVEIRDMDSYKIALQLINSYFNRVFGHQIQNLKNNREASISLNIKKKKTEVVFEDNECKKWIPGVDILHHAFLVDNPFIVDELNGNHYYSRYSNIVRSYMIRNIENSSRREDPVIETVLAKEKLKEINKILKDIAPGAISVDTNDGSWSLHSQYYDDPIAFGNLSAGLKSFVLLRVLLEKGVLMDKDVLVLDEPEIHLHPEWQIKYAEIIVLLQRQFDLSIVVTTHSREFLEAIELFSKKYGIQEKCNYYLAYNINGEAEFKNANDDLTEIYKLLITPSRYLDKIRFELEDDESL